ncbi:Gfo/Idh/MocA family protein [Bradyrhizobium betae]
MKGTGIPMLVGHHRRHNPIIKSARETVASGKLGQLTAVVGLWLLKKPDDYFEVAWRREQGGGPLLINLIHDIDNLRFICGEIVEVQALTSNKVRGFAVEDTAALLLRLPMARSGQSPCRTRRRRHGAGNSLRARTRSIPGRISLVAFSLERAAPSRCRPWSCGRIDMILAGTRRWFASPPQSPLTIRSPSSFAISARSLRAGSSR